MTEQGDVVRQQLGPPITPTGRGRRRVFLLAAAIVLIPTLYVLGIGLACGCRPPPPTPDVTSPVDGVVIGVDSVSLTDVRGFTLRANGGFAFGFVMGDLENPTEFPPGHLAEHQATSTPVRVSFRIENGERVVYRLEDASPSPEAT